MVPVSVVGLDSPESGTRVSLMRLPSKKPSILARYPELRRAFLKHYARYGSISAAATYCRISTSTATLYRDNNPDFAQQMEDAHDEHRARIERAIYERGVEGVEEPRFNATGQIGTVRKYSDQLLLAYAKRHIAEYREGDTSRVEVDVDVSHKVEVKQLGADQRKALRVLLGTEPASREVPLLGLEPVEVEPKPDEEVRWDEPEE